MSVLLLVEGDGVEDVFVVLEVVVVVVDGLFVVEDEGEEVESEVEAEVVEAVVVEAEVAEEVADEDDEEDVDVEAEVDEEVVLTVEAATVGSRMKVRRMTDGSVYRNEECGIRQFENKINIKSMYL